MNKKQILIIQQYFYPDISAVSQLLADLLSPLSDEYEVTVLCSSVYNSVEKYEELPESINGVKILRIRGIKAGKKSFFHRIAEYSTFYLGAFFHVLTHREYSLVVSMTTPPLIGFFCGPGEYSPSATADPIRRGSVSRTVVRYGVYFFALDHSAVGEAESFRIPAGGSSHYPRPLYDQENSLEL
jgi:hypothetical protein